MRRQRIINTATIKEPSIEFESIDGYRYYPLTETVEDLLGRIIGVNPKIVDDTLVYTDVKTGRKVFKALHSIITKHRNMSDQKNCPFHFIDKVPLINVGALKEFDDGKNNWCCPSCKRIWINVETEEWTTRQANVMQVKELVEGENYADVFKAI